MSALFLPLEIPVADDLIDALYKDGAVDIELPEGYEPDENQPMVLKGLSKSALALYRNERLEIASFASSEVKGVKGKDARQKLFLHLLNDPKVLMAVCVSKAGCGKTLLAVAYALEQYFRHTRKIILIKPSNFVGGKSPTLAAVNGGVKEKLEGQMASFMVHVRTLLGSDANFFLDEMWDRGHLLYLPIEQARGMNLARATVIFDEAQNVDLHIMKTIVSRVATSSKLIVLGDLGQIDTGRNYRESGLYQLMDSDAFRDSEHTAMLELKTQYRSPLATLMEDVWAECMGDVYTEGE